MTQKLNTEKDNDLSDLSKRFLYVIDKIGYSHYKIAKETKVISNAILTHIKNGRSEPSIRVICALLEHFPNINANWLLTGKGMMFLDENNKPNPTHKAEGEAPDDLKKLLEAKDKIMAIGEHITVQNEKIIGYFKALEIEKMIKEAKEEMTKETNKTKED